MHEWISSLAQKPSTSPISWWILCQFSMPSPGSLSQIFLANVVPATLGTCPFPKKPYPFLPSCLGLFFPLIFESLLFHLWLCNTFKTLKEKHTNSIASFSCFPRQKWSLPPVDPTGLSVLPISSFIKSFNKYWLKIYYVSGIGLRQARLLVLWKSILDGGDVEYTSKQGIIRWRWVQS